MATANEIYEIMKKAVEEGHGDLECFGVDDQGVSYEVETYGIVKTAKYIDAGPLCDYNDDQKFLSFHLQY